MFKPQTYGVKDYSHYKNDKYCYCSKCTLNGLIPKHSVYGYYIAFPNECCDICFRTKPRGLDKNSPFFMGYYGSFKLKYNVCMYCFRLLSNKILLPQDYGYKNCFELLQEPNIHKLREIFMKCKLYYYYDDTNRLIGLNDKIEDDIGYYLSFYREDV